MGNGDSGNGDEDKDPSSPGPSSSRSGGVQAGGSFSASIPTTPSLADKPTDMVSITIE